MSILTSLHFDQEFEITDTILANAKPQNSGECVVAATLRAGNLPAGWKHIATGLYQTWLQFENDCQTPVQHALELPHEISNLDQGKASNLLVAGNKLVIRKGKVWVTDSEGRIL